MAGVQKFDVTYTYNKFNVDSVLMKWFIPYKYTCM